MAVFELISNHLCPYTQRAAIQLAEKGLAYERVYIDLADKPEWFQWISPLGKVPLLRMRDEVVFETWVICEYIEEVESAVPLHPPAPLDRARHRSWAELASAMLADVFAFYTAPDEHTAADAGTDGLSGTQQGIGAKSDVAFRDVASHPCPGSAAGERSIETDPGNSRESRGAFRYRQVSRRLDGHRDSADTAATQSSGGAAGDPQSDIGRALSQ